MNKEKEAISRMPLIEYIPGKIDHQTVEIINGFKIRSALPLNASCYERESSLKVLPLKIELERPQPIGAKNGELSENARLLLGGQIMEFYQGILPKIARPGYLAAELNRTREIDRENILLINDRVCAMGPYVARIKMDVEPQLLYLSAPAAIEGLLRDPEREKQIINDAREAVGDCQTLDPDVVETAFKKIMDLTVAAEVACIVETQTALANDIAASLHRLGFDYHGPGFASQKIKRRGTVGWGNHPA